MGGLGTEQMDALAQGRVCNGRVEGIETGPLLCEWERWAGEKKTGELSVGRKGR